MKPLRVHSSSEASVNKRFYIGQAIVDNTNFICAKNSCFNFK